MYQLPNESGPGVDTGNQKITNNNSGSTPWKFESESLEKLIQFEEFLNKKRYRASTVDNYSKAIQTFFRLAMPRNPSNLRIDEINDVLKKIGGRRVTSSSYMNHLISAIKLYYIGVEKRIPDELIFNRPKIVRPLPKVLNREEVHKLILITPGTKNRFILMLLYGTGLKPGEVIRIRRSHIDLKNGLIKIFPSSAVEKSIRHVDIPETLRGVLEDYLRECNPFTYLFEGKSEGNHMAQRSLEMIVKEAGRSANIKFPVTCMTIRHSYAVHMIESGINLHYLKELLGLRSTNRVSMYLDIARFRKPTSPLDDIDFE